MKRIIITAVLAVASLSAYAAPASYVDTEMIGKWKREGSPIHSTTTTDEPDVVIL
jgi:hypothetical protein